jgi:hypothetical protein
MHTMKRILNLSLAAILISSTGCVSHALLRKARGEPNHDPFMADDSPDRKPHPGYYPYLLVTVPVDAVTLPFQAIGYGLGAAMFGPDR